MGNIQQRRNKEFLKELKNKRNMQIIENKDLIIFINQNKMIQDFITKKFNLKDLKQNQVVFENFLIILSNFLYKKSLNFEKKDCFLINSGFILINDAIAKMFLINKKYIHKLLWENLEDKFDNLENENILERKNSSIFLRLLISIKNFFFTNNFCVDYTNFRSNKIKEEIHYYGWFKSLNNNEIYENRINLLELLLLLYYIELDYMNSKRKKINTVLFFFKYISQNDIFFASLLKQATAYEENGIIPYSGYFYQNLKQKEMYCSALSLNLSILFLKESLPDDNLEKNSHLDNIKEYFNEINNSLNDDFLCDFFNDSEFLLETINKISNSILTMYRNKMTVFPYSLKPTPFIEEMIFLLLTFVNRSEKVVDVIVKMKTDINIIMPLLILLDQIDQNLNNGLYYLTLSCILKLSSSDVFCQRLNEENNFDYKFKDMPVISGDVIDYIICFFLKMIDKKVIEKDFDSIFIFLSILNNVSIYAVDLKKSTCKELFDLIYKLENYHKIINNLNILTVVLNLFVFLEKMIVYNWKSNTLLGSYFILNQNKFQRLKKFGLNKNNLSILLFKKAEKKISKFGKLTKKTKIKIGLSEEKEDFLEEIFENISIIKSRYNFTNLDNYLRSTNKNLHVLNKEDRKNIEKLQKFLDLYCLSNFFRQTSNIANRNFLNNTDLIYIKRFEKITALNIVEKFKKEDLKKIITSIYEN